MTTPRSIHRNADDRVRTANRAGNGALARLRSYFADQRRFDDRVARLLIASPRRIAGGRMGREPRP